MKPEQKFKQKLKKYFEKQGAEVFMIESPFAPGFPDIVLFVPDSFIELIETKVIKSEDTKIKFEKTQIAFYRRLNRCTVSPSKLYIYIYIFVTDTKKIYYIHFKSLINIRNLGNKKFLDYKSYFMEKKII